MTFEQTVQPTPNGPVVIDVMIGPRPGGTTTLETLLSDNTLIGRKTVTQCRRPSRRTPPTPASTATSPTFKTGLPSGGLVQQGQILAEPNGARSTLGITADGSLDVRRVGIFGTWKGPVRLMC